jgi:hypothetical protein
VSHAARANYAEFLATKARFPPNDGLPCEPEDVHPMLKPHQRALAVWGVRKGRCAWFADAGLGKTFIEVEWARLMGGRCLMLAPLSVARQTVKEAARLGVEIAYARREADARTPITITNYEMVGHFDPRGYRAVVLDESSILKATEGATRNALIAMWQTTSYRACGTATPAPNDIQELTNHSEFLSLARRRDVLATYFLHASGDARATGWRLKHHARPAFWRWLASWAMSLKRPSDLGYPDDGYVLPALAVEPVMVPTDYVTPGKLFADRLQGITERSGIRRASVAARAAAAAELIEREPAESWIAWTGLNDESAALADALGDRAIEVRGSDTPEAKAEAIEAFIDGQARVLVTKTTIAGFGMNFQHCARQVFVGLNDSYEQYYQAIRRSWRFGQSRPVRVYVVIADPERVVYENVLRKEREAEAMAAELVAFVRDFEREELGTVGRADTDYRAESPMRLPEWLCRS